MVAEVILPRALICDLDGTIALMGDRGPFEWDRVSGDLPNRHVIDLLDQYYYHAPAHRILIILGRSQDCEVATREWLDKYDVSYDHLHIRPSGDFRPDFELKQEIWD
jgi:hypothetical protein